MFFFFFTLLELKAGKDLCVGQVLLSQLFPGAFINDSFITFVFTGKTRLKYENSYLSNIWKWGNQVQLRLFSLRSETGESP